MSLSPLSFLNRLQTWLEVHWVSPDYSGWVMTGLAVFFFAAATNTMAGWLYAISGVMFALLGLGLVQPGRSLRLLQVLRRPIDPVSVGDTLVMEIDVCNQSRRPQLLLQVTDCRPEGLEGDRRTVIERLPAYGSHRWSHPLVATKRGLYRWQIVELRTAAPLGLFWRRRQEAVRASVVVYPKVLPLSHCPLIDELGRKDSRMTPSPMHSQLATEGVTRTLRPYRWGDSTRLIHWRTSARYGELRIREMEMFTGGQEVVLALDTRAAWPEEAFESAVVAAASLYFYAQRHGLMAILWTPETGEIRSDRLVLEALAAVLPNTTSKSPPLPTLPLIWLTSELHRISALPTGSRWLLWVTEGHTASPPSTHTGCLILPNEPLQTQLQASTSVFV
jgi:uncharacterized protein (DUF58 family)